MVVYKQLQYIQDKDLGFSKDHVLTIGYDGSLTKQFDAFRNDLLKNPASGKSAFLAHPFRRLIDYQEAAALEGASLQPLTVNLKELTVDDGLFPHLACKWCRKELFKNIQTDSNKWIINETTVKTLGWKSPQDALNKHIKYGDVWECYRGREGFSF